MSENDFTIKLRLDTSEVEQLAALICEIDSLRAEIAELKRIALNRPV